MSARLILVRLHVATGLALSGTGPLGAISIANNSAGTFGPDDEPVLTILASGAVIGLENVRLYQAEHERKHQLQMLLAASAAAAHFTAPCAENDLRLPFDGGAARGRRCSRLADRQCNRGVSTAGAFFRH